MGFNNNRRNDNRGRNNNRPRPQKVNPKNANPLGTPTSMQRHALHIFKDIAYGKWDIKESHVFLYPGFLENALYVVSLEMQKAYIRYNAVMTVYNGNNDPVIAQTVRDDQKRYSAYNLIYGTLISIQQYGDPNFIIGLVNKLPDFKRHL